MATANVELFIGTESDGSIEYYVSGLDIAIHKPKSVVKCALGIEHYLEAVEACVKRRSAAYDVMADVIFYNAYDGFGDVTGDDDFGFSVAWLDLNDFLNDSYSPDVPVRNNTDELSEWLKLHPRVKGRRWVLAYLDNNGVKSFEAYQTHRAMMRDYRNAERRYLRFLESVDA